MRAKSLLVIGVVILFLAIACSHDSASTGRDEADRTAATDHKSDSAEPADAAVRAPDNAGKCIAGACADQSPPTSP